MKGKEKPKRVGMVTHKCEWCGVDVTRYPSNFHAKHYFCSSKCSANWRAEFGLHGENHPNWKGGIIDREYSDGWHRMRRRIIYRQKGICAKCHKKKPLDVHHIIPSRFFNDTDGNFEKNLIALCRQCHKETELNIINTHPLFTVSTPA